MKIVMYAFLLPVMFFSISHRVAGQDSENTNSAENRRMDSLARVYIQEQEVKDEQRKDSERLSDMKSEKTETRTKAKEAQRVENDASDAARESKVAYRQEKKAQKARKQADKQSKKAAKARAKSDNN